MENCFSLNVLFPSPVRFFVSLSWYSRYSWPSSFLLSSMSPHQSLWFSFPLGSPKSIAFCSHILFCNCLGLVSPMHPFSAIRFSSLGVIGSEACGLLSFLFCLSSFRLDMRTVLDVWNCLSVTISKRYLLSPRFFKKASGILQSPSSVHLSVCSSVRPSVMLSPPKPLDEIQPNLVCELLTWIGCAAAHFFLAPPPGILGRGQKVKYN